MATHQRSRPLLFTLSLFVSQVLTPNALHAAELRVASDAELKAAIDKAQPGDTVLLAPGDYDRLEWGLEVTREKPITVRRMTRDEVVKAGGTVKTDADLEVRFKILRLDGAYTTFDGFRVLGDEKEKYNSAGVSGHRLRLTNCPGSGRNSAPDLHYCLQRWPTSDHLAVPLKEMT